MLFSPSSFKPPELGNYCSRATALTTGAGSGRALGGGAAGTGRREESFQVTLLHLCTRLRLAGCVVKLESIFPSLFKEVTCQSAKKCLPTQGIFKFARISTGLQRHASNYNLNINTIMQFSKYNHAN
uniref:Uncharacterized protein n=2 Tax=Rousettus aegyptiacus TaxID=9407 RepID=A0A7J8F1B3_ROUAE|nr:hypothetical protein HJG63_012349 [Rousettus aegyptiacus]